MVDSMREFKSLQPEGLPELYNVRIHGEEPFVTVEESEKRITIQFKFPGFFLSDDDRYVKGEPVSFKQVNISQTGFLAESGKPLLPSFGRYIQIPFNCGYTYTVKKSAPITFDDILVLPAQEKLTDSPRREEFEFDKPFYLKDEVYPEKIVEISGPFEIDECNALLVHVRPLQYNPAQKMLIGFGTITVVIDIIPKGSEYPLTNREPGRKVSTLFLNPGSDIEGRLGTERRGTTISTGDKGPEFLIIYHDTFKEAAEILAHWKNMRGLSTDTISLKEVGTTSDAVKSYIRTKRRARKSQLRYVLLLGDVEFIPPERILESPFGRNITDYYYSTKTGPDSKTQFVLPWLSVGRIPVKTAEEAKKVVEKIILYERDPPRDDGYYKRVLFAAYFEDKGRREGKEDKAYVKTLEYIGDHLADLGFSIERVYVSSNPAVREYTDGTPVSEEVKKAVVDKKTATQKIISEFSKGYLIVAHRDHGGYAGWVNPPFRTNHLNEVTGDTLSMVFSVNCLTGRFDVSRDCFSEKLLKMKGGAPSVIAATRPSHTWLNDDLMKALFDALWGGVLPFPGSEVSYPVLYNRLGDVLNYAKTYLPVAMSGDTVCIKDHMEIYHVIGDPTLELWKAPPLEMGMRTKVTPGYVDIVLRDCPRGSVITVWCKGNFVKKVEPWSTHVQVSLRGGGYWPVNPEDVSVCFWAPGYRFEEKVG